MQTDRVTVPTDEPQRPDADWLWHYLERVPPAEALLRAIEARLISGLSLPAPLLDLRDRFGRGRRPTDAERQQPAACAIVVATHSDLTPDADLLDRLAAQLPTGAPLLLCLPRADGHSADTWNALLNRAGFAVARWRSYYSAAQRQAAEPLRSPWPQLRFDLTGHYVLTPWQSVLDPYAATLRPYDVPAAPGPDDTCLFLIARRIDDALADRDTERPLPAADPTLMPAYYAPDGHEHMTPASLSAPATVAAATPAIAPATLPFGRAAALLWAAVALPAALFALLAMRERPTAVGSGLIWFAIALAALLGIARSARPAVESRRQAPRPALRSLALAGGGLLAALLAATQGAQPLIALPLWAIGILLVASLLISEEDLHFERAHWRRWLPPRSPTALVLGLTLAVALTVRLWDLTGHPFIINGIEAQLGLEAVRAQTLFGTAWLTNPILPLWPTRLSIALLGQTPLALRIWSPLIGAATVPVVFWAGRALWNSRVGLLAALLVAFSHTHIHYSRLGMSNIGDALLVTLALAAVAAGWHSGRRRHWLLAGTAIGASAFFYTAAHLLPLMLIALLALALLMDAGRLHRQLPLIGSAALLALVIALPQLLVYLGQPSLFMERANVLGIMRNGWLVNLAAQNGSNPLTLLGGRLWQAALGFHAALDVDTVYNPGVPLVNVLVGTLLLLGLGMALFHLRQMRYAVWLVAFGVMITFGGALLLDLPSSRRYVVALPAMLLLAARAAVWLFDKLSASVAQAESTNLRHVPLAVVLVIGLLSATLDVTFYFATYRQTGLFADRNSEIAAGIGQYLASLDDPATVYFHGAPSMYSSAPTITFLAPEYTQGVNLHDVTQPGIWPPATTPTVVHIFVPERSGELADVTARQPGGTQVGVPGRYADPLFVVYELRP